MTTQVLLADPDADGASPLVSALSAESWQVVCAADVATGFQLARQMKPQVVVMRDPLPGGGALALLQKLRGSAHTALIPVVAVVDAGNASHEEFRRWGAQALFEAPVSDGEVRDAVRATAVTSTANTNAPDQILGSASRLRALDRTGLLDSPPEAVFDHIAQLAARLLDVPVVLMSLVDRQRQYFKSQVGVPEPIASTRETPLSHSFCQWVVADQGELVVTDARRHPLLQMNGATTDLGAIAYAGVPLHGDGPETIGSFCAIDMKPRLWDERELHILRDAAHVIEGLTVVRQSELHPPRTLGDFRAATFVVAQGVHAATSLLAIGPPKISDREHRQLVTLAGDLGRKLALLSGPALK